MERDVTQRAQRSTHELSFDQVHIALVDCTNGISREVRLDADDSGASVNADTLWATIEENYKNGSMLACGSNTGTDTTIQDGIAMGHAYGLVQHTRF
jgi:hypothetical protein